MKCIICMQVVATVDENNPLDQPVPPRRDGLNHDLAAYISSKTSKLALPENDKQVGYRFSPFPLPPPPQPSGNDAVFFVKSN